MNPSDDYLGYLSSPADEFLLACLLLSPVHSEYVAGALELVGPSDFVHAGYGMMWAAARVVHERGERLSKRTVLAEAQVQAASAGFPGVTGRGRFSGQVPAVVAALDQVSGEPVYVERIPTAIDRVRHTARMRRLAETLDMARNQVITAGDYGDAWGRTQELLAGLEFGEAPVEVVGFSDLADEFAKTMASGGPVGDVVPTPWDGLNEVFGGGLYAGRFYVVAGVPGAGKSIVGVDIARHAAEQGFPALVLSVEMSQLEVTGRVMASGARVEYSEIARWAMSDETALGVLEYTDSFRDMPLWVCDRSDITVEMSAVLAEGVRRRHGLGVVVVDYVQLMEASEGRGFQTEQQQIAHISRSLKLLAKKLGVAVVAMAQLNRGPAQGNRRPAKSDLRGSGKLEQDTDGVVLLHHEVLEDGSPSGDVVLIVDKNRQGPCRDVVLRWRAHQARIG